MSAARRLAWSWLGRRPYAETVALQEALRRAVKVGQIGDQLLLLEHDPPVYTVGKNADAADVRAGEDWLAAAGIEVHPTSRGGQVTYHGPGQLVGYPIVDLSPDRRDVRRYVRDLQEVIIRTLAGHGLTAHRRDGQAFIGVWVGEEDGPRLAARKIASIGVHLSRWVSMHGFALNVAPDLAHFGGIVACGLEDVTMTSMAAEGVDPVPTPEALAPTVAAHAADLLGRDLARLDPGAVAAAAAAAPPAKGKKKR